MDSKSDKLWKKTVRDEQKRIKPGQCQKYIRLVIDSHVLSSSYGREFIAELNATADLNYEIRGLPLKESIIWERNMGQLALKPNEVNTLSEVWQKEKQIVKILQHQELVNMIKKGTLWQIGEAFSQKCPPNLQSIVLFLRSNDKQPAIISSGLIELQIMHQVKVLELEPSIREMVNQLKRLTKSIAEAPYKQQKSEILGTFKKFLANDKKQCVRVEGSNGFGRLWQQHLNRLPLVTLEVAETIIDKYSCPKKLIDDLKLNVEAVKDISDLKIKRAGPKVLQTDRRIGNVLSHKLYMLYNSKDPTTLI